MCLCVCRRGRGERGGGSTSAGYGPLLCCFFSTFACITRKQNQHICWLKKRKPTLQLQLYRFACRMPHVFHLRVGVRVGAGAASASPLYSSSSSSSLPVPILCERSKESDETRICPRFHVRCIPPSHCFLSLIFNIHTHTIHNTRVHVQ